MVQRFSELLHAVPREGKPTELRTELMRLLDRFGFRDQIAEPAKKSTDEKQLPQVMLNFNALEALRRAFVAAIKSIELAGKSPSVKLATFLTGSSGARSLHSRKSSARPTEMVCACSKLPMCVVCAFVRCSSRD